MSDPTTPLRIKRDPEKWKNLNQLFHWKIVENFGEVWASGIRLNGKFYKTLVFSVDVNGMIADTETGKMTFVAPERSFLRNVECNFGSMERYLRGITNLSVTGKNYVEPI